MPPRTARRPMLKLTPRQQATLDSWFRRASVRRCAPKELLERMRLDPKHMRTLYRMINERKTRSGVRDLHVTDKQTIKKCQRMRDERAALGEYARVPLSQVAEEMQYERNEGKTFLSPSRVGKASRLKNGSRDPCSAPGELGAMARAARLKADLKHHCR